MPGKLNMRLTDFVCNIKFLIRLLGDMCKCYVIITNVINQKFQKIALVSYNTKYKMHKFLP